MIITVAWNSGQNGVIFHPERRVMLSILGVCFIALFSTILVALGLIIGLLYFLWVCVHAIVSISFVLPFVSILLLSFIGSCLVLVVIRQGLTLIDKYGKLSWPGRQSGADGL